MSFKLFNYLCKKCAWRGELLTRTLDKPKCPNCKSVRLQKQLDYAGYHINGNNSGSTRRKSSGSFKRNKE